MRASLRILAVAMAILLAPAAPWAPPAARAQDSAEALVQRGISVEATAESAVQARERAHAEARRTAFNRLAAALGASAPNLSDATLEGYTRAIIVEEERTSPTRYAGRLTVRFSPAAAAALGRSVASSAPSGGGEGSGSGAAALAPPIGSITATANYAGFGEWRDLRARLRASGQVAGVEILSLRTDAAVMRLQLRSAPDQALPALFANGVAVDASGNEWRIGLAGGG